MSFKANLKIDNKGYTILDCTFDLDQQLDHSGRPSAKPRGGVIITTIELGKNTELIEWMISPHQTKSGTISFINYDNMGTLMNIDFENAYCARLTGQFNATNNQPLQLKLKISAQSIAFNGVRHINNWPVKN